MSALPYVDAAWTGLSLLLWWGVCVSLWRDAKGKPRARLVGQLLLPGLLFVTGLLLLVLR